jgi:hypothetical protein
MSKFGKEPIESAEALAIACGERIPARRSKLPDP